MRASSHVEAKQPQEQINKQKKYLVARSPLYYSCTVLYFFIKWLHIVHLLKSCNSYLHTLKSLVRSEKKHHQIFALF